MEAYENDFSPESAGFNPAVLIAGSATLDTIVLSGKRMQKIGGVATYAGITFRKHGIETHVLTNLAPSEDSILRVYRQYGIQLHIGALGRTTHFINRLEGDSRKQEVPGCAAPISWEQGRQRLRQVRHVHLGPLHPNDLEEDWLQGLKEFEGLISLDVQGYVRKIRGISVSASVSPLLDQALQACRVIKATEQEFKLILNTWKMEPSDFLRCFPLEEIIVTCGKNGGYLLSGSHNRTEYPALLSGQSLDTTGAGDVFFAAYLSARHYRGQGRKDALLHAARIASFHVGGTYIPQEDLLIRCIQDIEKGETE